MIWKNFFLVPGLFATVQQTVDGMHSIGVSFSKTSHNRIAVENGAVEKVIGDHSIFSVTIDPVTGNAFVHILEEIGPIPATLSVVTSSGLVQDLLITSHDGASEQVILREQEGCEGFQQDLTLASAVNVLNQVFEGKIPFGYGQREETIELDLPNPLESKIIKSLEGPFETITVYRIENTGKEAVVLCADALKKEGVSWVFLNVQQLHQGEQALCLLGRAKEGCGR